ncbi:hypothetical protein ACIQUY_39675 [Streptomyces sp. NPDC090231]|uniref:hypothetical protein n=1 Tax=unclassified Streptomyces TaxID=2593676 RepID=UPI00380A3A6D
MGSANPSSRPSGVPCAHVPFALTAASAAVLVLTAGGAATADDGPATRAGEGTTVNWQSDEGGGTITFSGEEGSFAGTAQFPGEGPVGYRGSLSG